MRMSWREQLAEQIRMANEDQRTSAEVDVTAVGLDHLPLIANMGRINLSSFCGAAPSTLLLRGYIRGMDGVFTLYFHYRGSGWTNEQVIGEMATAFSPAYPPIDLNCLDAGHE